MNKIITSVNTILALIQQLFYYNNPETDYVVTFTLDVDVQDYQVVQVNFPNECCLDENNISHVHIDDNDNANVYSDDRKIYEIHINE